MKKILLISLLCLPVIFCPSVSFSRSAPERAMFISVIQNPPVLSSREEIRELILFSKRSGVTTLFVQVYRENKAWFPSAAADSSPYQDAFKKVSEDPLDLLIRQAHAEGIQVHAWLNLLSLSANHKAPILKKYGPGILTRNLKEKRSIEDYKIDNQFFLEAGDLRVRRELEKIVGEVVSRYPSLDGIQFDYIRYPDWHPAYGYNQMNVARFKKATGEEHIQEKSEKWSQWKKDQVTALVRELSRKARALHPGMTVSTTGLVPYSRASLEAFQDWRYWVQSGLIDFVTLMCYTHEDTARFKRCIADGDKKIGSLKKVNIAVGPYALLKSPEIFKEQWEICEDSGARACVVFHYGNLLENPALKEPLLETA